MREIQAPNRLPKLCFGETTIFLAGSIEMNKATMWQDEVIKFFKDYPSPVFYNPRRNDWDSSWKQSTDCPEFVEQVEWELNALDKAQIIFMYLEPGTLSPISLLELGLFCDSGKLIVCCPEDFWRKGNVDITCNIYKVPCYDTFEEALLALKQEIEEW